MNYKLLIIFFLMFLFVFSPQDIKAACTAFGGHEECGIAPPDSCSNYQGGSSGQVYYDKQASDFNCGGGPSFNTHTFDCDTSCSGSGTPPPAGGGGSCPWTQVNCGAGTTINLTQPIGAVFNARIAYCPGPGTAQRIVSVGGTTCASGYYVDTDDCWIKPSGVEECVQEFVCRSRYMRRYACVSTTPTCTVDVNPLSIAAGTPTIFPASIPTSSGVITQVNFTSSNTSVATVTTPDTTASYATTATGIGAGTTTITASVVMSGSVRCTDSAVLLVFS